MLDIHSQEIKSFDGCPSSQMRRSIWYSWVIFALLTIVISGCATRPPGTQDKNLTPSPLENSPVLPTIPATSTVQPSPVHLPSPTLSPFPTPTSGSNLQIINSENVDQLVPIHNLIGHEGPVLAVDYSPDGNLIATGSEDNTVRIWDSGDGSLVYELVGHTDAVNDLTFSSDGSILASGSNDGTVRFWKVDDGHLIRTIDSILLERVRNVEFSPKGTLIAVGGHKCFVELRYVSSGIFFRTIPQPLCRDRDRGAVDYWGLAFTSDGQEIITGEGQPCCGGSVQRREVEKYSPPTLLQGYQLRVRDLDISPDDSTLALAFIGSPVFWLMDAVDGSLLQTFEGHTFRVNSVVISPDGKLIASGSRDESVGLWTLNGELLNRLDLHTAAVNGVAFSPNGESLASASDEGIVIMWGIP